MTTAHHFTILKLLTFLKNFVRLLKVNLHAYPPGFLRTKTKKITTTQVYSVFGEKKTPLVLSLLDYRMDFFLCVK